MAKNSTLGSNPVVFPSFSSDVQKSRNYAILVTFDMCGFVQPFSGDKYSSRSDLDSGLKAFFVSKSAFYLLTSIADIIYA
jgi:hypothetical protein